MKTILATVLTMALTTTGLNAETTFTVTDPDRGLYQMHPALVQGGA